MGIANEVVTIADHLGISLEKVGGFNVRNFSHNGSSGIGPWKKHQILKFIGRKRYHLKPTGLKSLEKGNASEIEFINGYIVDKGKELGIETPLNEKIVRLVKEIEAGNRNITPDNLLKLS